MSVLPTRRSVFLIEVIITIIMRAFAGQDQEKCLLNRSDNYNNYDNYKDYMSVLPTRTRRRVPLIEVIITIIMIMTMII